MRFVQTLVIDQPGPGVPSLSLGSKQMSPGSGRKQVRCLLVFEEEQNLKLNLFDCLFCARLSKNLDLCPQSSSLRWVPGMFWVVDKDFEAQKEGIHLALLSFHLDPLSFRSPASLSITLEEPSEAPTSLLRGVRVGTGL